MKHKHGNVSICNDNIKRMAFHVCMSLLTCACLLLTLHAVPLDVQLLQNPEGRADGSPEVVTPEWETGKEDAMPGTVSTKEDLSGETHLLLHHLLQEIERMRLTQAHASTREELVTSQLSDIGLPCDVEGTWWSTSTQAALQIRKDSQQSISIEVGQEELVTGFQLANNMKLTSKWSLQAIGPKYEGGPFTITGFCPEGNHAAVFIGQCRICGRKAIISGSWIMLMAANNCPNLQNQILHSHDIMHKVGDFQK